MMLTRNTKFCWSLIKIMKRNLDICRSWCPDRTIFQARAYIAESAGEKYAEGVILNLETTWEESNIRTPLIGLLSMGSDPTSAIEGLAKRKDLGRRMIFLSKFLVLHV